jgi:hypothetical protein
VAAADDQKPVETLGADGADKSLCVGVRLRRLHRRTDHRDSFAAEHFVEGGGEFAVAIMNQERIRSGTLVKLRLRACWTSKEGTIGWPEHRASLLPSEHDELMSQHEQLDIFGELAAPVPDQQPEHNREGEIGERKEHPPILPSAATEEQRAPGSRVRRQAIGCAAQPVWYSRARVKQQ